MKPHETVARLLVRSATVASLLVCSASVAGLLPCGASVRAAPPPLAWWPLDDGVGTAADLAHGRDGTLFGPTWVVDDGAADPAIAPIDCNRDALHFSGDDYVAVPDVGLPALDGLDAFSVSAWIRPDLGAMGADPFMIVSKYNTQSGWVSWYLDVYVDHTIIFVVGGDRPVLGAVASDATVTGGVWTHVLGTWDGLDLAIYLDGVPVTTHAVGVPTTYAGTMTDTAVPIEIGAINGDSEGQRELFFVGDIDDVRLYDEALTPTDVAELAAGGAALEACDACPLDCPNPTQRMFFGVVRRASDQSLGSVQCWTDPGEPDGLACRRQVDGSLLIGPPECGP